MAKKNEGCLMVAIIWAVLVTIYYIFMFDYKHNSFSWLDAIIAISALVLLIGGISSFSQKRDTE